MKERRTSDDARIIRECIARIRQSGALDRSQTFQRLLDYLAERAAQGEVPKEFDISVDVFGKDHAADAQTRVHIYKLRTRLDTFYAGPGKDDPYRLEIPKGTYRLVAVANEALAKGEAERRATSRLHFPAVTALVTLLVLSVGANVALLFGGRAGSETDELLASAAWSGLFESNRPVLIVVGDHFFFGEEGGAVRIRDIGINSKKDLLASANYGSRSDIIFDETLTYLPKSVVFSVQTILSRASAAGQPINMKLVSELTSDDLRDYDVIYVGFVRAMGILRDYYFARSNFRSEPPLFMNLTHAGRGEVYVRFGPVPEHNTDYGLFARFSGPSGNQILVFAGIGDVGVLAAVHAVSTPSGIERVDTLLQRDELDASRGFEVLLEADGHSRTDLGVRVLGAYALSATSRDMECCAPQSGVEDIGVHAVSATPGDQ